MPAATRHDVAARPSLAGVRVTALAAMSLTALTACGMGAPEEHPLGESISNSLDGDHGEYSYEIAVDTVTESSELLAELNTSAQTLYLVEYTVTITEGTSDLSTTALFSGNDDYVQLLVIGGLDECHPVETADGDLSSLTTGEPASGCAMLVSSEGAELEYVNHLGGNRWSISG